MNELTTRQPRRPLLWPDALLDLQSELAQWEQPIYIVGGAVRDAWQQHAVADLDLITPSKAIPLARHIANQMDGDVFVMDAERDVARVLLNVSDPYITDGRMVIDVAQFRAKTLLDDLRDRDFTINAMAVDLQSDLVNSLIDPLGGEDDLERHVLRRCSPQAIANDPLRALRGVRQSAQLRMRIEPETIRDIRSADISTTSIERVRNELFKIFTLDRPVTALRVAGVLGILDIIIPEIPALKERPPLIPEYTNAWEQSLQAVDKMTDLLHTISHKRADASAARFEHGMVVMALDRYRNELLQHLHARGPEDRPHEALLYLGALLHLVGPDLAQARALELRLSNDEKKAIGGMVAGFPLVQEMPPQPSDLEIHRFWHPRGKAGIDACLLALAHYVSANGTLINEDAWLRLLETTEHLLRAYYKRRDEVITPPPLLNGDTLMDALGMSPGRHIGTLLDYIREGQVTGEIRTVEDALNAARQRLSQNGFGEGI
jgi:tRNA nucleotidyltransferase/poly(A) polymerase